MNVALTVDERTSPTTNAQSCLCVTLHDIMADVKWMCIARVILPRMSNLCSGQLQPGYVCACVLLY